MLNVKFTFKGIIISKKNRIGGTAALKYMISSNRDQIDVSWKKCSKDRCRKLEAQMYDLAKTRGEELLWSARQ